MTTTYGQFCPVAMASEVLTERWTPLVVRELLCGSTRFNDLRRGVPLMSPALLSKRLKTLERVGVVEKRGATYHLTPAGEELRTVIESMGVWGQRWARGDVVAKHFDASLLMWDIHRNVVVGRAAAASGSSCTSTCAGSADKKSHFWLVLDAPTVDLCLTDPGHDVDVEVAGHVGTMVDYWMGRVDLLGAVRAGDLEVAGPRPLVAGAADVVQPQRLRPGAAAAGRLSVPRPSLSPWPSLTVRSCPRSGCCASTRSSARCRAAARSPAWTGTRWRVGGATVAHVFGGEDQVFRITFRGEPDEVAAFEHMGDPYFRSGWGGNVDRPGPRRGHRLGGARRAADRLLLRAGAGAPGRAGARDRG